MKFYFYIDISKTGWVRDYSEKIELIAHNGEYLMKLIKVLAGVGGQ